MDARQGRVTSFAHALCPTDARAGKPMTRQRLQQLAIGGGIVLILLILLLRGCTI